MEKTASTTCKKTGFGVWYCDSDLVHWECKRLFTQAGKKLPRQDLKITYKWDKEITAVAGKGQTDSHFIHVAALFSAGSGFPMRNNWLREQLNTAQEVLVLWIWSCELLCLCPSLMNLISPNDIDQLFWMLPDLILLLWFPLCCHKTSHSILEKSHFFNCTQNFNTHH